jgi:hypothetical protein
LDIPIFIVKKIMALNNIFQRIKNSVRAQKSDFCSRATSVTLLESSNRVIRRDTITYINCDGVSSGVTYSDIAANNNYIPDCVRGGSTIDSELGYKYFVQYGTTDCETPPPSGGNIILIPCNGSREDFIVDPTGYNLIQGGVYRIQLNPLGPVPFPVTQCYTVGEQTSLPASYRITGIVENVGDCNMCRK